MSDETVLTPADRMLTEAESLTELADLVAYRDPRRSERFEREAAWLRYQASERYYSGSQDY